MALGPLQARFDQIEFVLQRRAALRLGYLSEAEWRELDALRGSASRLTWRLDRAVSRKRRTPTG